MIGQHLGLARKNLDFVYIPDVDLGERLAVVVAGHYFLFREQAVRRNDALGLEVRL